jgi:SulP family sulfate permease
MRKLYEKEHLEERKNFEPDGASADESTRLISAPVGKKAWDWNKLLPKYFTIIRWVRNYSVREDLRGDLFAGCTVAFMTFPQAMGYALLAGLHPIYGLYASFVPVFIYALFGTSAEMCVGPAAMVSLMIPDTIAPLAPVGSDTYVLYATFLSFLSGVILFTAGMLNGGFIVENILSVPLLMGWIQGAAVLIIVSQMSGFFQISIPATSNSIVHVMGAIISNISSTNGYSLLIGGVCLVILYGSRLLADRKFPILKKLPISLLVLSTVTVLCWKLDWEHTINLNVIGDIPKGIPSPAFFALSWDLIQTSFKAALAISIIGFMEGISLAKKFAALRKYRIDVSQELRALGLANMIGSLFKAFPVTGSVTRTTVNYQSGSRTTLSSFVNGTLVGCVLLFLAPLFYYTPKAALSAIVTSAGMSLIDIQEMMFLWKIKAKYDLAQLVAIFLITLFTGPEIGAVVAILVSVIQIIYNSTRPTCVMLGPVSGTTVYKGGPTFAERIAAKGILVARFDSNLHFYTMAWLKEKLYVWESELPSPVNSVIFDGTGIESADATGVHGLKELVEDYQKRNICVFFSNLKPSLYETLDLSGIINKVGEDAVLSTTHEAVEVAEKVSYSRRSRVNRVTVSINS